MNAMVQKAGASDHSQNLYRWLRLVSLSSEAEVAIAAGQWDFLRETANSFEGLIRNWPDESGYNPALYQVLRLNFAAVNVELARESAHRKTLTGTISSLRQAIDASKRYFSPVDARISIATTSHALALADANWDKPNADLQDVADEVSAALDLAVTALGREHPGSVILARQMQALRERLSPCEFDSRHPLQVRKRGSARRPHHSVVAAAGLATIAPPRYTSLHRAGGEAPVTTEPEDQMAVAAAGRSRLRASHADREHVIDMLKAAFVHGRVTKDDFDARVGQTFASRTYAELAAVTADIPARQIADQPPSNPAHAQGRRTMGHAAKARRCVVIALAMMAVATCAPGGPALLLFAPLCLTALMVAAAQILASQHEKRCRGQLAGP